MYCNTTSFSCICLSILTNILHQICWAVWMLLATLNYCIINKSNRQIYHLHWRYIGRDQIFTMQVCTIIFSSLDHTNFEADLLCTAMISSIVNLINCGFYVWSCDYILKVCDMLHTSNYINEITRYVWDLWSMT